MPKLICEAHNCIYNKERLCDKSKIYVGGLLAEKKNETECVSFEKGEKNNYTEEYASCLDNCCSEDTAIDCSSEKCIHNYNKICKAEKVKVSGKNACTKDQTCCDTFSM